MTEPSSSSLSVVAVVGGAGGGEGAKICINTFCKETTKSKKGWRLRSGEDADLCDRCFASYEQGSFCDTFHSENDGWRKCVTCQKRVHCGCIVSVASFVLLDVGGIDCVSCAQKCCVLPVSAPNLMWSSSIYVSPESERPKEPPGKNWNQLTASSQVPGQWRPAPNAWSSSIAARSELHQRLSFEFDRPNSIEKLLSTGRSSLSEKRKVDDLHERKVSNGLNRITTDRSSNGNSGVKSPGFTVFHREDGSLDKLQESNILMVDSDPIATRKGIIHGSRFSSSSGVKIEKVHLQASSLKDDPTTYLASLSPPFSPSLDANNQARGTTNKTQGQTASGPMAKQLYHNSNHNSGIDPTNETHTQMRNGRLRVDARSRNQLLPRYWPRITDQELQQISGDSNSIIIPLFEKMLSASDAGRIGRLVLPKKCAEAYFPAISQPEGLPLKVQDATGKDWVFQFRFWPNNNSRMYVLEGVTPCIQSMQLQAGDTVTFSRIDPEGKLVMGFRKASNTQNEQASKLVKGLSSTSETSNINIKHGDLILSVPSCPVKAGVEFTLTSTADRTRLKNDNSEFKQKERPISKFSVPPSKRKIGMVTSKRKRLRIENEDSLELKLTWEEAQELLRPPPNHHPSIMVIEGHEFEEYEEAPVFGKPTIFITNHDGSSSLSTQEISKELEDVLPLNNANPRKNKAKDENDTVNGSDGLDTLANLAILVEGESPSQPTTTKHPRHRPGCTCIVCIQPPSGKGPKHKQSCCCNVCLTVKRRFRTLLLRKEKRQSEKEAETARRKQKLALSPEASLQQIGDKSSVYKPTDIHQKRKTAMDSDEVANADTDRRKELLSVVKTEIDLNIQPEREEEISPVSDIYNAKKLSNQNPKS